MWTGYHQGGDFHRTKSTEAVTFFRQILRPADFICKLVKAYTEVGVAEVEGSGLADGGTDGQSAQPDGAAEGVDGNCAGAGRFGGRRRGRDKQTIAHFGHGSARRGRVRHGVHVFS